MEPYDDEDEKMTEVRKLWQEKVMEDPRSFIRAAFEEQYGPVPPPESETLESRVETKIEYGLTKWVKAKGLESIVNSVKKNNVRIEPINRESDVVTTENPSSASAEMASENPVDKGLEMAVEELKMAADYYKSCNYIKASEISTIILKKDGITPLQEREALNILSACYVAFADYKSIIPYAKRHVEITIQIFGKESEEHACSILSICTVAIATRSFKHARDILTRAMKMMEKLGLDKSERYGEMLLLSGNIEREQCQWKDALVIYQKAQLLVQRKDDLYGFLLDATSTCYKQLNQWNEALACCKESVEYILERHGNKHIKYATAIWTLADFYVKFKKYPNAIPLLTEAFIIYKSSLGNSSRTIKIGKDLGAAIDLSQNPHRESIDVGHMFRMCNHCSNIKEGMETCIGCCCVWYCNKECQLADWERHKQQCCVCFQCDTPINRDSKIMKCSACKKTKYCNRECQKLDWKKHKEICSHQPLEDRIPKDLLTRLDSLK